MYINIVRECLCLSASGWRMWENNALYIYFAGAGCVFVAYFQNFAAIPKDPADRSLFTVYLYNEHPRHLFDCICHQQKFPNSKDAPNAQLDSNRFPELPAPPSFDDPSQSYGEMAETETRDIRSA